MATVRFQNSFILKTISMSTPQLYNNLFFSLLYLFYNSIHLRYFGLKVINGSSINSRLTLTDWYLVAFVFWCFEGIARILFVVQVWLLVQHIFFVFTKRYVIIKTVNNFNISFSVKKMSVLFSTRYCFVVCLHKNSNFSTKTCMFERTCFYHPSSAAPVRLIRSSNNPHPFNIHLQKPKTIQFIYFSYSKCLDLEILTSYTVPFVPNTA